MYRILSRRYVQLSGDAALQADFYGLLRNYSLHFLAHGARSLGQGGTPGQPAYGGGVLFWNESLSLLWNANLEHSRLGSYWSCCAPHRGSNAGPSPAAALARALPPSALG
jgi:hypothetical protein